MRHGGPWRSSEDVEGRHYSLVGRDAWMREDLPVVGWYKSRVINNK